MNSKIEEKAKTLVSYIENTTKIEIKRIQIKFVEDITGEVFFIGIINDLLYMPKGGIPYNPMRSDESSMFSGSKIIQERSKWKAAEVLPVCYGEFCDY